jgi:hypothetical protein
MKRELLSMACATLAFLPQGLQARDRTPAAAKEAPPKDETVAPADVPPYVLKNKSKFNAPSETARVPFWPVGWSKQKQAAIAVAAAAPEVKMKLDKNSFNVSSILIGGGKDPSLAVINERPYAEGEYVRLKGSSTKTRIRVERIYDGTVTLSFEDQKIVVPLRRQELNQHKDDNELLDPNR